MTQMELVLRFEGRTNWLAAASPTSTIANELTPIFDKNDNDLIWILKIKNNPEIKLKIGFESAWVCITAHLDIFQKYNLKDV